ncbi:MAG: tetratricopeptide repeat protein, partial [FCB group bacterium]|nr:tetratricopeptide repeat protein [FCB group bacterium]
MKHLRYQSIIITLVFLVTSCAYFNTFYNAEQYFEKGEALRLEKAGEAVPSGAREAYKKVIAKTDLVLEKYPDSKYVYPALLLQGKARFYRGEFIQAEQVFRRLSATGIPQFEQEAQYWLGLIKWKTGQPNPALQDLLLILDDESTPVNSARIYLSMAEIHLEIGQTESAINDLEKAADITKNSAEREQIYYRLANLSLNGERYDEAIRFYKSVIKNSMSKKRILEANLQIVRIHRLRGDLKTASNRIKSMLADERFKDIYADLELELAKLYQLRNEMDQSLTRLETITNDFQKTPASAEAYFLLGEQALKDWDLEDAAKYFGQVGKEDRKSPFLDRTRVRIKEISRYRKLAEDFKAVKSRLTEAENMTPDSVVIDTTGPKSSEASLDDLRKQIPEKLSDMAELEAFHFDKPDSARLKLEIIYKNYTDFENWPKAAYTLSHLMFLEGDSAHADTIRSEIVKRFPHSEFADAILESRGGNKKEAALAERLFEAEHVLPSDTLQALKLYRSIFIEDSTSAYAPRAMFFLANFYDRIGMNPDSAAYYYQTLKREYPESDQVKAARDRIAFYQDWVKRQIEAELQTADTLGVADSVEVVTDSLGIIPDSSEMPVDPMAIA